MAGFLGYKTYAFKDKDPIIDALRTAIADSGVSYEEIHERSGVAETTLFAWFYGLTRRPRYATVAAVAGAIGYDLELHRRHRRYLRAVK